MLNKVSMGSVELFLIHMLEVIVEFEFSAVLLLLILLISTSKYYVNVLI